MEPYATTTRPTFLTVLCILSFIGGLWGAVEGFRNAFTGKAQADLEEARAKMEELSGMIDDGSGFAERMMEEAITLAEKAAEHAQTLGLAGLVFSVLGLLGVWRMWNLRKDGFWIYTFAALAGLAVPLALLGGSGTALLGMGFGAFITLLFIVLYALNLKHMR